MQATVLYDAGCGFCTWAALGLVRRARGGLRAVPIRSAEGDALLGDLTDALRDGSWHLVAADGRRWSAGAALAPLLRLLPGLGWLAPVAASLPWPVERGYRLVARNRALLSRLLGGRRCGTS